MGRHVLSVPRRINDSRTLRRQSATELFLSKIYVIAALCFALGCLSYTNAIPYVSDHRWIFFAVSGSLFCLLNARDLGCVMSTFAGQHLVLEDTMEVDTPSRNLGLKERRGAGSENVLNPDVFSAGCITAGSFMLLNSAVIALWKGEETEASRWQLIGSFSSYIIGYAANTVSHHRKAEDIIETRNAVVFQMSMASTLQLVGAIADAPGFGCESNVELRTMLQSWLHGVGGTIAFIASLVNHFHTIAFVANEEILFAEVRYNAAAERRLAEEAKLSNRSLLRKLLDSLNDALAQLPTSRNWKKHSQAGLGGDDDDDVYLALNSESDSGEDSSDSVSEDFEVDQMMREADLLGDLSNGRDEELATGMGVQQRVSEDVGSSRDKRQRPDERQPSFDETTLLRDSSTSSMPSRHRTGHVETDLSSENLRDSWYERRSPEPRHRDTSKRRRRHRHR